MLRSSPGGKSRLGLPAMVTRPGLVGCLYWRWLPRMATSTHPSVSMILMIHAPLAAYRPFLTSACTTVTTGGRLVSVRHLRRGTLTSRMVGRSVTGLVRCARDDSVDHPRPPSVQASRAGGHRAASVDRGRYGTYESGGTLAVAGRGLVRRSSALLGGSRPVRSRWAEAEPSDEIVSRPRVPQGSAKPGQQGAPPVKLR
jgi:hypothetical protein